MDDDDEFGGFRRSDDDATLGSLYPSDDLVCEEARETLDEQIDQLRSVDKHALRILRVNILVVGLLLSAVSISARQGANIDRFLNLFTVSGGFSILISAVCASGTFLITEYDTGIGAEDMNEVVEKDLDRDEIYEKLVTGYSDWIEQNEAAISTNGLAMTGTMVAMINGMFLLSVGGLIGAVGPLTDRISLIVLGVLLMFLLILDYIMYKLDVWVDFHRWNQS